MTSATPEKHEPAGTGDTGPEPGDTPSPAQFDFASLVAQCHEFVEAIARRDVEGASEIMRAHLDRTARRVARAERERR